MVGTLKQKFTGWSFLPTTNSWRILCSFIFFNQYWKCALCIKKYNNVVKEAAIHVHYSILKIIIENTDPYSSFRRAETTFKRYIPAIGVRLGYSVNLKIAHFQTAITLRFYGVNSCFKVLL